MKKKLTKKQYGGTDSFSKTNAKGKTKNISEKRYDRIADRYQKQEGSTVNKERYSITGPEGKTIYPGFTSKVTSGKNPNKSVTSKREDKVQYMNTSSMKKGGSVKKKK
jgi:hypothetical protein